MIWNKINVIVLAVIFSSCGQVSKVDIGGFVNTPCRERTIVVTGSADMTVVPDEIEFVIGIREYFEEEFKPGKEEADYRTKVSIQKVENELMSKLSAIGISKRDIKIKEVGNYWRNSGRHFQINKLIAIKLKDFKLIEKIVANIGIKGLDYLSIQELRHKQLQEFRKKVKTEALKAAKTKAEYLLASMNKKPGEIISIRESQTGDYMSGYWGGGILSNVSVGSGQTKQDDNYGRTINLRYDVEATFEIK